ncbi:hypothetical protein JonanDRAFT_1010 [Jonquetella anthropi DSM 22815]|uniref:Uncharacterized protein n=1 Tax=Jonquetella anthropi DSM 22815 TaxID=885272 RepID=H0UL23_9BACT|nr:hypothetical protein [Jonquetella anthropi]EHM13382.1 hypothetical protein JonanDRAFT_1010 [Jonquetella anthropi DSM 22815]
MVDQSRLGAAKVLWDHWRFEPWQSGTAEGLYRKVTFIKAGILGEVGRYYVNDFIVWRYEDGDVERLFRKTGHKAEVMTHRYLFVSSGGPNFERKRSIWLGCGGFVEAYGYALGSGSPAKGAMDLAYLADQAVKIVDGIAGELEAEIESVAAEVVKRGLGTGE